MYLFGRCANNPIDGESIGKTPLYAEAVPDGALLIVPAAYAAEKGLTDVRSAGSRDSAETGIL